MIIQLKNAHMGEGLGRGSGRVAGLGQTFCRQSRVGSGQRFAGSDRVGFKKSGPWTTLRCIHSALYVRAYDVGYHAAAALLDFHIAITATAVPVVRRVNIDILATTLQMPMRSI